MKGLVWYLFRRNLLDNNNGKKFSFFQIDIKRFFFFKKMIGSKQAWALVKGNAAHTINMRNNKL